MKSEVALRDEGGRLSDDVDRYFGTRTEIHGHRIARTVYKLAVHESVPRRSMPAGKEIGAATMPTSGLCSTSIVHTYSAFAAPGDYSLVYVALTSTLLRPHLQLHGGSARTWSNGDNTTASPPIKTGNHSLMILQSPWVISSLHEGQHAGK